jgi:hypothetical protein
LIRTKKIYIVNFFRRFLDDKQVSVRILGDIRLAPEELQKTLAKAVLHSKNFKK